MKWIVITLPTFIPDEARLIAGLFQRGLDVLHLRKPGSDEGSCRRLLDGISECWHERIVVHDHFSLCRDYGLLGVHLNGRHPQPPADFQPRSVSASCHSVDEARRRKDTLDYVFLSPIFDSISKQGYSSAYTPELLADAHDHGFIDRKVMALGGFTLEHIPRIREWGFGGAVFLGDVWNRVGQPGMDAYLERVERALHRRNGKI